MTRKANFFVLAAVALLFAACAPTATESTAGLVPPGNCASDVIPTVAIDDFLNTTSQGGVSVIGVEDAATARLITLMKESGCYVVVERSELLTIMQKQGLESMDPVDLAKAAGAGYLVTGTVTRATVAKPGASLFGLTVGSTTAQIEVDVRATDIITGEVVVSMRGAGEASSPSIAVNRIPTVGTISYNDPAVGPLFAEAANDAVIQVVNALRSNF